MSLRRSRRLRGLAPEEQAIDQVCVICQGRIFVNLLGRCVRTSCCGMLMHRACHGLVEIPIVPTREIRVADVLMRSMSSR